MEGKISDYSISLLLCLFFLWPLSIQGQNTSSMNGQRPKAVKKEKKQNEVTYPLYNGVFIGADLWGIGSKLLGGDRMSAEVVATADLKHRYFPTLELGYGDTDEWNENGIHYKSKAPYFRLGADYNALYKKKHGQMLLVGLRYGFSSFKHDVEAAGMDDPIYGGSIDNPNLGDGIWGGSVPYNHKGMKGNMQWIEFCLALRAHIWKQLYMGWGIRIKYKLTASSDRYGDPWYVPGFGKYGSNTIGISYTVIYKLPF